MKAKVIDALIGGGTMSAVMFALFLAANSVYGG